MLKGQLLIASAGLLDPNFRRSVVLVTEHNPEGAMGVVLNRPSPVPVADAVPHLGTLVEEGGLVFVGGPVQPEAVVALAELDDPELAAATALGSIGYLRADADPDDLAGAVRRARVFAGYWGGEADSSSRSSNRRRGSSSLQSPTTCSRPTRTGSGRRFSVARAEPTRSSRACRSTRRSTDCPEALATHPVAPRARWRRSR